MIDYSTPTTYTAGIQAVLITGPKFAKDSDYFYIAVVSSLHSVSSGSSALQRTECSGITWSLTLSVLTRHPKKKKKNDQAVLVLGGLNFLK